MTLPKPPDAVTLLRARPHTSTTSAGRPKTLQELADSVAAARAILCPPVVPPPAPTPVPQPTPTPSPQPSPQPPSSGMPDILRDAAGTPIAILHDDFTGWDPANPADVARITKPGPGLWYEFHGPKTLPEQIAAGLLTRGPSTYNGRRVLTMHFPGGSATSAQFGWRLPTGVIPTHIIVRVIQRLRAGFTSRGDPANPLNATQGESYKMGPYIGRLRGRTGIELVGGMYALGSANKTMPPNGELTSDEWHERLLVWRVDPSSPDFCLMRVLDLNATQDPMGKPQPMLWRPDGTTQWIEEVRVPVVASDPVVRVIQSGLNYNEVREPAQHLMKELASVEVWVNAADPTLGGRLA